MNKAEIAVRLRDEVGHLEAEIKKLHNRCERLKQLVLDLEEDIAGSAGKSPVMDGKLRKIIDSVFGEQPNRPKRQKNDAGRSARVLMV
jgi:hypothetical protein